MLTVATVYHQGLIVPDWSTCYTPEWVDKLYRGVARNYTKPFRFVCLTDNAYKFQEDIETHSLWTTQWEKACIQLYGVQAKRLVLMGLDTIITGNVDHIFAYNGPLAVPRDPYTPERACNGVVLCPTRTDIVARTGISDMRILDYFDKEWLDDLFPGQIKSYKVNVLPQGLGDARIVYFHGEPKPHVLNDPWIQECWQ